MTRIAECKLGATNVSESPRVILIAVSQPEPDPRSPNDTTFRTLVEFDGLYKPRYIRGEGSLQSLALAFSFIRARLKAMSTQGWVLNYPGTDYIASPDLNLFGDEWIAPPDSDSFWDDSIRGED